MSNHASHAALPYPVKNARYTMLVPLLDADGDPTAPTTPDTEISKDNGTAADAVEEVSATSGMDGVGMITFTGAETDCSTLAANFKSAAGPKATLATLYPRVLASVGTGTLSAGSAGGGTLGTLLAYDVTGCFIKTTGGTGGGGTGGANNQARKIVTYNTSTGAFTVEPNWETTPSTDTTYAVLLPEGVTLGMLKTLNPATPGRTLSVKTSGYVDANVEEMHSTSLGSYPYAGQNLLNFFDNNLAASTRYLEQVTYRDQFIDDEGTAQAGASGTITLRSGASSTNSYYNGAVVKINGGTGAGQTRKITGYVGSTRVATVDSNWVTAPDNTSTYIVLGRIT